MLLCFLNRGSSEQKLKLWDDLQDVGGRQGARECQIRDSSVSFDLDVSEQEVDGTKVTPAVSL